jgi:hypothetical protein
MTTLRPWIPPLAFTLFILLTLPLAPVWWNFVLTRTGENALTGWMGMASSFFFFSALAFLLFRKRGGKIASLIWLLGVGFCYWRLLRSVQNIVEQAHLLEYGILAVLYYISFKRTEGGRAAIINAWIISSLVGIVDEGIQFYLPTRVGEAGDICLNAYSSALGLVLWTKVLNPCRGGRPGSIRDARITCGLSAIFLCLLGIFITIVMDHGFRHRPPGIGAFYSRFSLDGLKKMDTEKGREYVPAIKDLYPEKMHQYLKRQKDLDKYLAEVLVHLFRRDRYEARGDYFVAFKENLILSKYFPKSVEGSGKAWPPEKEAEIRNKMQIPPETFYESPVSKNEIFIFFDFKVLWVIIFLVICSLFRIGCRFLCEKLCVLCV